MLFKSLAMEVKANTSKRTFSGYASKFGNVDLHNDIIEKGAFTKTISERKPKNMIKVLWQHIDPIGMPDVIEETDEGLYVEGKISKTQKGDEAIELMRDGVVDGMSIGYDVIKDDVDQEKGVRLLKELKLYEVSIVTWGANPEASITNVKHLQALNDIFKSDDIRSLGEIKTLLDKMNNRLDSEMFGAKDGNIIINMEELKAGKVLSKSNRSNLEQAVQLIESVLETGDSAQTGNEEDQTDDGKSVNLEDDTELKSLLSEIRSYAKK